MQELIDESLRIFETEEETENFIQEDEQDTFLEDTQNYNIRVSYLKKLTMKSYDLKKVPKKLLNQDISSVDFSFNLI